MEHDDILKQPLSRMVYLHRVVSADGKEGHLWLQLGVGVDRLDNDKSPLGAFIDDHRTWLKKGAKNLVKGAGVGEIYDFPSENDGGTVWSSYAKSVGFWPHDEDRAAWNSQHRAALAAKDSRGKRMKEVRRNLGSEALEPFRVAYHELPHRQRTALLAWIVQEVTKFPGSRR